MGTGFKVGTTAKDVESLLVRRDIFDDVGLFAWGGNGAGQLGDGNPGGSYLYFKSSPIQIGSLTNWKQVFSGPYSTTAIKIDGSLWTWGANGASGTGDWGDGTSANTQRSSPVQVGSLTDWKTLIGINAAIKYNGTLWTWGNNSNGSLGISDIVHRSSPVQVGSLTNWKSGIKNSSHLVAIKEDGTLWSCGFATHGQLGSNNTTSRSSPVQVGALTDWKQVSGSWMTIAAIKTDGTLWTWGHNGNGQLGNSDVLLVSISSPIQIGSSSNWRQVSCGYSTFGVKNDSSLWSWGRNSNGELGLNDLVPRSSPVQVGSLNNWKYVSSSASGTTLALKIDGTLWGWGLNADGQLGLNDRTDRSSPVQIGSLTKWKKIHDHTIQDGWSGRYAVHALR